MTRDLEIFILKAKRNGWVASENGGTKIPPSKIGSLDITFEEGDFHYHDSFIGLTDFCGQEHICHKGEPIWSMVYYGNLIRPELATPSNVVSILKIALGKLYDEGRFLGEFSHIVDQFRYEDRNNGDFRKFSGIEKIFCSDVLIYELSYIGGLVKK